MTATTEKNIIEPWAGSGIAVVNNGITHDAQSVMEKAGLNWEVEGRPLMTTVGGPEIGTQFIQVDSHKVIVRKTDEMHMGIVGKNWNILQNYEVFEFLDELAKRGTIKYHSAGSFKQGRLVWVQCEFMEREIVPGDTHKKYLLICNGFDGAISVVITSTSIRIACLNTLRMAFREGKRDEVRIRHTASMREKLEAAKTALIKSTAVANEHDAFLMALVRMRMTGDMWTNFGQALIPDPEEGKNKTRAENARAQLMSLALTGMGQDIPGVAGTAYSAFNAVTEYANYHRTSRGATDEVKQAARFESTLFGASDKLIMKGTEVLNGFLVDHGIQVDNLTV